MSYLRIREQAGSMLGRGVRLSGIAPEDPMTTAACDVVSQFFMLESISRRRQLSLRPPERTPDIELHVHPLPVWYRANYESGYACAIPNLSISLVRRAARAKVARAALLLQGSAGRRTEVASIDSGWLRALPDCAVPHHRENCTSGHDPLVQQLVREAEDVGLVHPHDPHCPLQQTLQIGIDLLHQRRRGHDRHRD